MANLPCRSDRLLALSSRKVQTGSAYVVFLGSRSRLDKVSGTELWDLTADEEEDLRSELQEPVDVGGLARKVRTDETGADGADDDLGATRTVQRSSRRLF